MDNLPEYSPELQLALESLVLAWPNLYFEASVADSIMESGKCRLIAHDTVDLNGRSPLQIFAARGSEELVNELVMLGADPNVVDEELEAPLHRAVRNCHPGSVKMLVEWGADPDSPNLYGVSPRQSARQRPEVFRGILE